MQIASSSNSQRGSSGLLLHSPWLSGAGGGGNASMPRSSRVPFPFGVEAMALFAQDPCGLFSIPLSRLVTASLLQSSMNSYSAASSIAPSLPASEMVNDRHFPIDSPIFRSDNPATTSSWSQKMRAVEGLYLGDRKERDEDSAEKKRRRFTEQQQQILVRECLESRRRGEPFSKEKRREVAARLGLTEKQVTTFINNLKAKQKKTKQFYKTAFGKTKGDPAESTMPKGAVLPAMSSLASENSEDLSMAGSSSPSSSVSSSTSVSSTAASSLTSSPRLTSYTRATCMGEACSTEAVPAPAASYHRLLKFLSPEEVSNLSADDRGTSEASRGAPKTENDKGDSPFPAVIELTVDAKEKFRFSATQLEKLMEIYEERRGMVPVKAERLEYGKLLGLTERQIHSFFNNRKAAERKKATQSSAQVV